MAKFNVASIGLLKKKDKVLLVKEGKSNGKWAFPGGGLEKGEKLRECVQREIKEETGINAEATELIGTYIMKGDNSKQMFVYAFQCQYSKETPKTPEQDTVEKAEVKDINQINQLNLRFQQMKEILKDSKTNKSNCNIKYI